MTYKSLSFIHSLLEQEAKKRYSLYKEAAARYDQEKEGQHRINANGWNKYGKSRTYISTRIYTNAWNLKAEKKLGYVDNMTGAFVAA